MGLRAVESLPLTLSLGRRPLFELGQTATLLIDHLLTWREEEGADQWVCSDFVLRWKMEQWLNFQPAGNSINTSTEVHLSPTALRDHRI